MTFRNGVRVLHNSEAIMVMAKKFYGKMKREHTRQSPITIYIMVI